MLAQAFSVDPPLRQHDYKRILVDSSTAPSRARRFRLGGNARAFHAALRGQWPFSPLICRRIKGSMKRHLAISNRALAEPQQQGAGTLRKHGFNAILGWFDVIRSRFEA